jgi:hypothetical protein
MTLNTSDGGHHRGDDTVTVASGLGQAGRRQEDQGDRRQEQGEDGPGG